MLTATWPIRQGRPTTQLESVYLYRGGGLWIEDAAGTTPARVQNVVMKGVVVNTKGQSP